MWFSWRRRRRRGRLDGEDLLDLIRKGSLSADDEDAGADGEAGSQETSA